MKVTKRNDEETKMKEVKALNVQLLGSWIAGVRASLGQRIPSVLQGGKLLC